jgi:hypothetical protein
MESVVWIRGRDFPLEMLEDRLRCPRCGSRYKAPAGVIGAGDMHGLVLPFPELWKKCLRPELAWLLGCRFND